MESLRFEATPKPRRDEHIDASTGLSSPRLSGQCSATTAATAPNAYGLEDMPINGLGLTPGLIERALAEGGVPIVLSTGKCSPCDRIAAC